jgi:hypothetical protein
VLAGDLLGALTADDLNVAVGAQEWVDSSMCAISASTALLCTIHLCVPYDQIFHVQSLDLSIRLTVGQ